MVRTAIFSDIIKKYHYAVFFASILWVPAFMISIFLGRRLFSSSFFSSGAGMLIFYVLIPAIADFFFSLILVYVFERDNLRFKEIYKVRFGQIAFILFLFLIMPVHSRSRFFVTPIQIIYNFFVDLLNNILFNPGILIYALIFFLVCMFYFYLSIPVIIAGIKTKRPLNIFLSVGGFILLLSLHFIEWTLP